MTSKKRNGVLIGIMLVCMVVYNICVFLITENHTSGFWVTYGFTMVAMIIELAVPFVLRADRDVKKDAFFAISPVDITSLYCLVQLLVGIILMVMGAGVKLAVVVQIVILGVYLVTVLLTTIGTSHASDRGSQIKSATATIKSTIDKAESIYKTEHDEDKKAILKKLYEAIRYSDPVSSTDEVRALDSSIKAKVLQIAASVQDKSPEELTQDVDRVLDTIQERNILCASSK